MFSLSLNQMCTGFVLYTIKRSIWLDRIERTANIVEEMTVENISHADASRFDCPNRLLYQT